MAEHATPPAQPDADADAIQERESLECLNLLGESLRDGKAIDVTDSSSAFKYFRMASEKGHLGALFNLGTCYMLGDGVARDETEAVRIWRVLSDQNYTRAHYQLGILYLEGACSQGAMKRGPMMKEEAAKHLQKAADAGDAESMYVLAAQCYRKGIGTEKNHELAFKLFKRASDLGHIPARVALGMAYRNVHTKIHTCMHTYIHTYLLT
jgi:TPR repeat protein